jgi:hypothetical protein
MAELPRQVCTVHRRMPPPEMNTLMSEEPLAADSALLEKLKLIIDAAGILLVRNGESVRACNWDDHDTAATLAFRLNVKYHVRHRLMILMPRSPASPPSRPPTRRVSATAGMI